MDSAKPSAKLRPASAGCIFIMFFFIGLRPTLGQTSATQCFCMSCVLTPSADPSAKLGPSFGTKMFFALPSVMLFSEMSSADKAFQQKTHSNKTLMLFLVYGPNLTKKTM